MGLVRLTKVNAFRQGEAAAKPVNKEVQGTTAGGLSRKGIHGSCQTNDAMRESIF